MARRPWLGAAHNGIQRKLLAAVSALIFSSAILVISLGHLRFVFGYSRQAAEDMQQLVEQVALNIDNYLDELARLCLSPYYSDSVMDWLDTAPATGQEQLDKRRNIEGYLRQVMTTPRKDILRVYILADAVYSCARTGHSGLSGAYNQEPWYLEALSSDGYVYLPADTERPGSPSYMVFSVAKRLRSLRDSDNTVGVIRVDANYSGIKAVCDRVAVNPDGALFILDAAGTPIYENSRLPEGLSAARLQGAAPQSGYSIQTLDRTAYILNTQPVSTTGWRVIAVNSRSEITKDAKTTLLFNLCLAIVLAVLGVAVSAFYVRKLLRPLYQTVGLMEQVQSGDLDVRAPDGGGDEIAYLNAEFNRMLARIQAMILQEGQLNKQIYEAKYLQKQAQFDALHHQIQPHFLFNTLNTISLLVKCGQNQEAVSSIDQLAVLLRGGVNANREIDLASELKITESYLHLQKLRHDHLSYDIQTHGIDLGYKLPALTIQPLVENALVHGCEDKAGEIAIQIGLWAEDGRLTIQIRDNGVGMDRETLAALREQLAQCESGAGRGADAGGIGLVNIQRRIHLIFGGTWGVRIDSTPGEGTTAILTLPWRG